MIFLIWSDLLNCLRRVGTIVVTTESGLNSLKVIFTTKYFTETLKAAISRCFDVFPVRASQKFQVQVKMSTLWPVFPDYLSVSYDYVCIWG